MKFTIDIDCTPEEARAFFGWPNVEGFQAAMMKIVQERMTEYLESADAETLAKMWLPTGLEAWESMQKSFMSQFMAGAKKAETK